MLKKTVGNWVDGDRFFGREADLELLRDRVREGTPTLLTAQRRMGKTSLVRESFRRLEGEREVATLFVDLEDSKDPADAIVAIGLQARPVAGVRQWLSRMVAASVDRVDEVQLSELRIKLRARIDGGNWKQRGDELLDTLSKGNGLAVLALDELPLFVNRILVGSDYRMTQGRIDATDEFLSWLRRKVQEHRDRLCVIISGSVGIAPILKRAGLSSTLNVFSPYELKPWSESVASDCLGELGATYNLTLHPDLRVAMCHRLRSNIPHHVQQFFDAVHRHLDTQGRSEAKVDDIETAYHDQMLGVRGRLDMDHYEERLKMVLGPDAYVIALDLLARTAADGVLTPASQKGFQSGLPIAERREMGSVDFVLDVLQHDGYLERGEGGLRFASGLLEDWQRARQGLPFRPFDRD